MRVQSLQSCLTPGDLMDYGFAGSSAHGILQARILEWVSMPTSRGSCWSKDRTSFPCIAGRFFTPEPLLKHKSGCKPSSLLLVCLCYQDLSANRATEYRYTHTLYTSVCVYVCVCVCVCISIGIYAIYIDMSVVIQKLYTFTVELFSYISLYWRQVLTTILLIPTLASRNSSVRRALDWKI